MPTRLRKVRRLRGSRTMSYGQVNQHRHSGQQGGHGAAGLHKHKWSWLNSAEGRRMDPHHWGRDDFKPPGYKNVTKWVNVGDLWSMVKGEAKEPIELDLSSMGIEKLLGSGDVEHAFTLKVPAFTERAKLKIEQAGGKILER